MFYSHKKIIKTFANPLDKRLKVWYNTSVPEGSRPRQPDGWDGQSAMSLAHNVGNRYPHNVGKLTSYP